MDGRRNVSSQPLDRLVEAAGPLPPDQQVALAVGLADALVAIHSAGVVHRDLKPANVLCPPEGPKVIDFGISAAADASRLTSSGLMIGSPGWLAPEQLAGGDVGPATDIFTFGLLICFAASGHPPFGTGPTEAIMFRAMSQPPFLDRTRMVPALANAVERATAFDPQHRPTARQLLDELLAIEGAGRWSESDSRQNVPSVLERDWRVPQTTQHQSAYAPPGPWADAAPSYPLTRQGRAPGEGRPKWVIPAVVAAALVLLAGGIGGSVALVHGSHPVARVTTPPVSASAPAPSTPGSSALGAPAGQYRGSTSQDLPISFVVGTDGQVGTVNFDEKVTCTNLPGQKPHVPFRGLPTTKGPLDQTGVFTIAVQLPEQTFRMTGNYGNGKFVGAFRHVFNDDATGNLTLGTGKGKCDSDQITFEAFQ